MYSTEGFNTVSNMQKASLDFGNNFGQHSRDQVDDVAINLGHHYDLS